MARGRTSSVYVFTALWLLAGCSEADSSNYYPLNVGEVRTYQITIPQQGSLQVSVTNFPQREMHGRTVVPRKYDFAGQTSFDFVADMATGACIAGEQGPGRAEPTHFEPPRCDLGYPARTGTVWDSYTDGSVPGVLQTMALPAHYRIVSSDDTVTVSAGTYSHCLKVVGDLTGHGQIRDMMWGTIAVSVRIHDENWYAPGIGLVKMARSVEARRMHRNPLMRIPTSMNFQLLMQLTSFNRSR